MFTTPCSRFRDKLIFFSVPGTLGIQLITISNVVFSFFVEKLSWLYLCCVAYPLRVLYLRCQKGQQEDEKKPGGARDGGSNSHTRREHEEDERQADGSNDGHRKL